MAASDELKEALVHYFRATGVKSTEKDWKRVAKAKLPSGEIYREFENKTLGRTVYVLGEDEDCAILEKDVWLYGVYHIKPGEEMFPGFGSMSIAFEPQDRWKRQGFIYDQHQQYLLEAFFPAFPKIGEDMENSFSYEDKDYSDLTIHMALKKAGFTFSQEITDFLNNHTSPGTTPPTAPINPPTPPALTSNSAPATKAPPAPTVPTSYDVEVDPKNIGKIAYLNAYYQDDETIKTPSSMFDIPDRANRLMSNDEEWGGDRFEIDKGHLWVAMDGMDPSGAAEVLEYYIGMAKQNPDIKLMVVGDEDGRGSSGTTEVLLFNQGFNPSNDPHGYWSNKPNGGNGGGKPSPSPTPAPTAAPQGRSAPSGALGGYHGTGLLANGSAKPSDFIVVVAEDDGEVVAMITPMMAYARDDGFDQEVGPLVDHLLPSDWYEASEQTYNVGQMGVVEAFDYLLTQGFNVDWKEYKDDFKDHLDVYDVTREIHKDNLDKIANPIVSQPQHHHNPISPGAPNNTGYPELTGQEAAVQAALVGARVRGVLGLEQESSKWDDAEDIDKNWAANHFYGPSREEGQLELERSHALWLLYEHYDQGSGLAFPNFFGMDNVRVAEEIQKILDLDDFDEDDGDEITIIDDLQSYPAPYDLPVPAYVPPPPIVHQQPIQTSKPAPKPVKKVARGPSMGTMTGSGSFTPVSTGPAPVVDEDDTPVGAEYIHFDSGEQWPEFCGAVWDHYAAKGPGAVEWSDRFRPRHAQIIGLGYKFDRVEFTGIRVQMGYLGKDFKILDNIDIPGAVFDELFADWGGEWNDDDNIQMINKKAGTDPDTGFSYSSSGMWEVLEPYLRSKGWLPAK